ncbi:MAG: hypothetical protein WCX84_00400 [Syntrophales bacterium]|jgi:hypothetical protein|nr:hypothetical protein [Syntrophales bacterium]NLN59954.1 hypothetical protein [Deltaproteobacteria bacterium]
MFEPLWTTSISIPLFQLMLVLVIGTLTLVIGKVKLSLVVYCTGILYWAYFRNPGLKSAEGTFQMDAFSIFLLGIGVVILFLTLIGLLTHQD